MCVFFKGFGGLVINKRIVVAVTKQMDQGKAGLFVGFLVGIYLVQVFTLVNFCFIHSYLRVRHCFPFSSVALTK